MADNTALSFESGQKRLAELEALVKKKKQEINKSRRAAETKLKVILGAYFVADTKRLNTLLREKDFQAFLSDKDKDFIRAAVKVLINEKAEQEKTSVEAGGSGSSSGKAPAYLENMAKNEEANTGEKAAKK